LSHFENTLSTAKLKTTHYQASVLSRQHGTVLASNVQLTELYKAIGPGDRMACLIKIENMKTIELKNEPVWWLGFPDITEQIKYEFSDQVHTNLEVVSISAGSSDNFPVFEGNKFDAPRLKYLILEGAGSIKCFQTIDESILSAPLLEEIHFHGTRITRVPEFISKIKTLKHLTFRYENFQEIPFEISDFVNLEYLSFEYCHHIKRIPDDIKNLVNLKHFDLWEAGLDYLSPELFLLPAIKHISLAYSQYTPTGEVRDALKIFNKKGSDRFVPWENFVPGTPNG
jgi:Leucine-rich repeat (LRR) protein